MTIHRRDILEALGVRLGANNNVIVHAVLQTLRYSPAPSIQQALETAVVELARENERLMREVVKLAAAQLPGPFTIGADNDVYRAPTSTFNKVRAAKGLPPLPEVDDA